MRTKVVTVTVAVFAVLFTVVLGADPPLNVPRTWADNEVASFELPLANPEFSPQHVSEAFYYALPERVIWKSYSIYHPEREPEGYREKLALLEPEVVFDATTFETEQDWIEAGTLVFQAPIAFDGAVRSRDVTNRAWYEENRLGLTSDGVFPWARWVIREKGKLEVANLSCAMCHTRLMPDGTLIEGAQGNFPFERVIAWRIRQGDTPPIVVRAFSKVIAATPWIDRPLRAPREIMQAPLEQLAAVRAAMPPGVIARQGTAFDAPVRVPDLIGIRDRKYLDATGLVLHRSIGDLMRYAAANQTIDLLARYGDFVPATATRDRPRPGVVAGPGTTGTTDRYSDAQLYALALYIYSLKPPPNPNSMNELARRGEVIFEEQACADCHTPPLYTNNRLVPVPGFRPPPDHYSRYDLSRRRVNTDPTLAMTTRRGTGYYKVPSLRGVWYRRPLQHEGAVASLEDWFDPNRIRAAYRPTGFAGVDEGPRPVRGHLFGMDLKLEDRRALIAFLRTL